MGTVSGPAGCLCTFMKTCRNATLAFQATDPNHQTASNDGEKHKYAGISFKVDQPRSVLIQMFFCFGDWSKTIVPCFGFECPFTSFGFARARSVLIHPHFFVAHVTHVSYHRGAKNSPEHDPNPGGRWQVCPVDDQRRTTRRQKEAKCTSKRRIEAGIKPAERNNCKSGEPLRQLRQPRFNPKATWILHHHSTFFIPMWVRTIPVQQFEGCESPHLAHQACPWVCSGAKGSDMALQNESRCWSATVGAVGSELQTADAATNGDKNWINWLKNDKMTGWWWHGEVMRNATNLGVSQRFPADSFCAPKMSSTSGWRSLWGAWTWHSLNHPEGVSLVMPCDAYQGGTGPVAPWWCNRDLDEGSRFCFF